MHPRNLSINDFTYHLPDDRIAFHPLENRDDSKLLIYRQGTITHSNYKSLADYLPEKSLLVFNNTKVIAARILFTKPTGGVIEIFCLEPYGDNKEYNSIMSRRERVQWKCMIGGAAKWKEKFLVQEFGVGKVELKAELIEKLMDAYVVEFSWQPATLSFAEVIEGAGNIPLPPYIKRKPEAEDKSRYQTIYAAHDGSVAAPTAGLHFTENVFSSLKEKNISSAFVTLHVGAGTFKPVKSAVMEQHEMHAEWIAVGLDAIENLIQNLDNTIVAVGTTSLRTIESLYWIGAKILLNPELAELKINQWDVYDMPLAETAFSAHEALSALIIWLRKNEKKTVLTSTQILIAPGYTFRIAGALITNFHQPQSTLLLLVAAAVGENWKRIYEDALKNEFRFLSYGDGSLLFIDRQIN